MYNTTRQPASDDICLHNVNNKAYGEVYILYIKCFTGHSSKNTQQLLSTTSLNNAIIKQTKY
jgi:hypothetical protein